MSGKSKDDKKIASKNMEELLIEIYLAEKKEDKWTFVYILSYVHIHIYHV